MQAVLIKKNADQTVEIIKRGEYPNLDMEPVQGLDPDLEWLLVHEPFVQPDYDPRIYMLEQDEVITSEPHPVYPLINKFKVTFRLVKRTSLEMQTAVTNAESNANEQMIPYDRRLKILTLGLAVLCRKTQGLTLTIKEQALFDQVVALGTKVWKNDANMKAKIADINLGLEPNIDTQWENA